MIAGRTNEFEERTKSLLETNTTINVLMKKREEDRRILEENYFTNIGELVIPCVEKKGKAIWMPNSCFAWILQKNIFIKLYLLF